MGIFALSLLTELIFIGGVALLVDMLAWGTCGYLIFRYLLGTRQYGILELVVLTILYGCYEYFTWVFLDKLDISIGNEEFMNLMGEDFTDFADITLTDHAINFFIVAAGYAFGVFLYRKLTRTASNNATSLLATKE